MCDSVQARTSRSGLARADQGSPKGKRGGPRIFSPIVVRSAGTPAGRLVQSIASLPLYGLGGCERAVCLLRPLEIVFGVAPGNGQRAKRRRGICDSLGVHAGV